MQILSQQLPKLPTPFTMIPVEGGPFLMGDEHGDLWEACLPVHKVTVPDFYIGQFPVTQALWKAVMKGENPSDFQGDDLPVEQVSWDDITQQFLPELRKITGLHYRLPTEAEWEYAARGGKYHDEGYKYAGSDRLKDVGWFSENSDGGTKPVGQKSANQLGIYDMSGNVWEWCEDDWHDNYKGAPIDGSIWYNPPNNIATQAKKFVKRLGLQTDVVSNVPPERGPLRVGRGGGWFLGAQGCRTADRNRWLPDGRSNFLGFRLALSLQADGRPAFL